MYIESTISKIHTIFAAMIWMCWICQSDAAKILGIFTVPDYSHSRFHQNIMKKLVSKGHHVTVLSPNPLEVPIENYTDINISHIYHDWNESVDLMQMEKASAKEFLWIWKSINLYICKQFWKSAVVHNFDRLNGTSFDLIIYEWAVCCRRLAYKPDGPPVVIIMPYQPYIFTIDMIGNYYNPSYIQSTMLSYPQRMSWLERIDNVYNYALNKYWYSLLLPQEDQVLKQLYGTESFLPGEQLSLLMVHSHSGMFQPKPDLPNLIKIRGTLINCTRNQLSKRVESFLSDSSSGVIYFSLGTNINTTNIPDKFIRAFSNTFSKLKQKVLWKWDSETVPLHSDNVLVSQWLQQQDVLAHPNVRLFITQGGALSLQESIYYAVPVLGIPFLPEQRHNLGDVVDAGLGLQIRLKDVTGDLLLEAINRIINDGRFKDNAVLASRRFKDEPEDSSSLERAVWWLEYTLRHGRTPHLRSATLTLNALQLYLIDVLVFFLFICVAFLWLCSRATISFSYLYSKHTCRRIDLQS